MNPMTDEAVLDLLRGEEAAPTWDLATAVLEVGRGAESP